ncbi:MAG: recombinase family protein [Candidatus Pacearchaeota archaeon]
MKENEPLSIQNLKPKAAIYVRVSTEEQAKQGFSLAAQEDALKNYAQALNYEIFKIYRDEGKSAKDIKHRPALQQLLKDAQNKKFNAIFVYKLDRFSRSLKDLILTIEKLKEWQVDFISLQDKIETASASGKLMFHIISAFAEFERDIISERTRFGMNERAKEGKAITKPPLGYKLVNGKLEPDENKDKVKNIFETFLNTDLSLTKLAKKYNLTTRGLIKLLKNTTYIGTIKFKKNYEGKHQPIVNQELFNKVQEKLQEVSFNNLFKKNIKLIYSVLVQGDSRYDNWDEIKVLAYFLAKKAIIVRKKTIPEIIPKKEEIAKIAGPQQTQKYIAKILLKAEGYDDSEIFFERNFGSIPDVSAIKPEREIFVECGPCYVHKVIEYLEQKRELWVLTNGALPWEKELFENVGKMGWFIFEKGPKWDEIFKEYKEKKLEELKKIKNPLDEL